jgi:hypothetical protein
VENPAGAGKMEIYLRNKVAADIDLGEYSTAAVEVFAGVEVAVVVVVAEEVVEAAAAAAAGPDQFAAAAVASAYRPGYQ